MQLESRLMLAVFLAGVSLLSVGSGVIAQETGPEDAKDYDPRDLTGIWVVDVDLYSRDERFDKFRPPDSEIPEGLEYRGVEPYRVIGPDRPPMTDEGLAKFAQARTSYGDPWTGRPPAPAKEWNDPTDYCDPDGYPRVMFGYIIQVMRFVQTPTVLLQMFERPRMWRDIWMDGRPLPENPEPRYYGYATANWDGDTLVVTSTGFNGEAWLDTYGHPSSEDMELTERFTRVSKDKLEWHITLVAPSIYKEPWVGIKTLTLSETSPRSEIEELREDICIWSHLQEYWEAVDTDGTGDSIARPPEGR